MTTYAAMAENMPSGSAARPSDVLTMYGGKTVEVLNTDAEGRLVLGDALVRASEDQPDLIVDVATLTGACVVALGTKVAGAFANTDTARDRVVDAAVAAGEAMWPLPIPAEMLDKLRSHSKVADLANITGEPWGGALRGRGLPRRFRCRRHRLGAPGRGRPGLQRRRRRPATPPPAAPGTPSAPWWSWPPSAT